MKEAKFLIFSMSESDRQDEPMFWSVDGWVRLDKARLFTQEERQRVDATVFIHDAEWINEKDVKATIAKFNATFLYSD